LYAELLGVPGDAVVASAERDASAVDYDGEVGGGDGEVFVGTSGCGISGEGEQRRDLRHAVVASRASK
jgi:hypothetical protein